MSVVLIPLKLKHVQRRRSSIGFGGAGEELVRWVNAMPGMYEYVYKYMYIIYLSFNYLAHYMHRKTHG